MKKYSAFIMMLAIVVACGPSRKVSYLNENSVSATLSLADDVEKMPELSVGSPKRDTIQFQDFMGQEVLVMKAIKDETTGEMVASDVIDAAVVTARFRNVAERNGKVSLSFNVTVPESMQDSKWQIRFTPDMFILEDSIRLEPVIITGSGYRKAQLKGYQQYEKFLSSIVPDDNAFVNRNQLELFLQRNIPQLYTFRNDSSEVSDERFFSYYGVSEQQAVEHYTNKLSRSINNRKKENTGKMYQRYVKSPIVTEGIRLDTVMVSSSGEFIYNYIQTIETRPKLKKADIVLSGAIFEQDRQIYTVPRSEPLTFYISSVSAFTDNAEKYLTKIIERRVEANTESRIEFNQGKYDVKPDLSNNMTEIGFIQQTLASLIDNEVFDLDSIVVSATASPEGSFSSNRALAQRRSESVSRYFEKFLKHYRDSLVKEKGISINLDENYEVKETKAPNITFTPRCIAENWEDLYKYVENDMSLTGEDKETFNRLYLIEDPDERERVLKAQPFFDYVNEKYYSRLRTVKFNFFLHRKGLVQDVVTTTVLDTAYMRAVRLLKDMEYQEALSVLMPYNDFNTAVAYVALDRNFSAMQILQDMERTADVNYLLSILYARQGDVDLAIQCYVNACQQNQSYIHRGNLDPEISTLIKTYELDKIVNPDIDFDY